VFSLGDKRRYHTGQVRADQHDRLTDPASVTSATAERPRTPRTERFAALVAVGIFCSRVAGLVRQRVFAHYFGLQSDAADAFMAAFRIPNVLQNLFGEGALSASFIPVYAALVARGEREEASRLAGAVAALLGLVTALLVLVGVAATPWLIAAIAPGFVGPKRDLTVSLVRILFPGAGLLALSAWCLGILNSHHRFLLSYTAPVLWNVAMIATLVLFGAETELPTLAWVLAWGSVVGSALQLGIQLPAVHRLVPNLRMALDRSSANVRTVVRNFAPVFVGRGVVQISAYVDTLLASLLPTGAVTGLANAQLLYTVPVSLFGMSVSAAELPAMSGAAGLAATEALRNRLDAGLRHIAFFVVPSAVAFLVLGDVVAAALLQTGRFTHEDAVYVWAILAGSAVGLLASTLGRLYASTYYALRDTRTPLRCAVMRVVLTTLLGYVCAILLPPMLGLSPRWGTAGLTASAGVSGWVELTLLRRTMNRRLGATGLPARLLVRLWASALAAAGIAWLIKISLPSANPIILAGLVLGPYGVVFLGATLLSRVPEAELALLALRGRLGW
jgi:putative peptidoglycan lipid II flippase